jgi:hypothetical protein
MLLIHVQVKSSFNRLTLKGFLSSMLRANSDISRGLCEKQQSSSPNSTKRKSVSPKRRTNMPNIAYDEPTPVGTEHSSRLSPNQRESSPKRAFSPKTNPKRSGLREITNNDENGATVANVVTPIAVNLVANRGSLGARAMHRLFVSLQHVETCRISMVRIPPTTYAFITFKAESCTFVVIPQNHKQHRCQVRIRCKQPVISVMCVTTKLLTTGVDEIEITSTPTLASPTIPNRSMTLSGVCKLGLVDVLA